MNTSNESSSEFAARSVDLAIPIYLDANALLDLLASLEGGFSMVERLTTRESQADETETSVKGEFGVANVLNLLRINVGAGRANRASEASGRQIETERYHTYGSLLYRLRETLAEHGVIKTFDGTDESWRNIGPSDFVELHGVFRPNPLAESLQTVLRILRLIPLTTELEPTPQSKGQRKAQQAEAKQMDQVRKLLEGLVADLEGEDVHLFVIDLSSGSQEAAVVTLFPQYLRDRSQTELSYGEFKLFGKVVRNLAGDEEGEEGIDLLRGTALGGLSEGMLDELLGAFKEAESEGMSLPDLSTKVSAPALQVVPIAIYV